MSVRLTTSLSQRLVLTPQLRQRIEMLQMTSLELTDLIQQQLTENPVLEEVATQEEARELAEKILGTHLRKWILAASSRIISIPVTRRRSSNTRKTHPPSSSFLPRLRLCLNIWNGNSTWIARRARSAKQPSVC